MAERKIITLTPRDALKDLVAWFDLWRQTYPFPPDLGTLLSFAREALAQDSPAAADDNPNTPEMVDRVARAIGDADKNRLRPEWRKIYPEDRELYIEFARAAIAAMREPTEAMFNAGEETISYGPDDPDDIWRAMIAAALGE